MRALIQRVQHANVKVEGDIIGEIKTGLLLLLGIEKNDTKLKADKLLDKVLKYRIFNDVHDKMNLALTDINGELLIVSQFTIVADTRKGLRPSFSLGASPEHGKTMYDYFTSQATSIHKKVATGCFGANMEVSLLNDGPVTFILEI